MIPYKVKWLALRKIDGGAFAARALGVTVGRDCLIYSGNFGSEPWLITLGDRVCVSFRVDFITHDASGWLMRDESGERSYHAPIRVGNDVFLGAKVTILPGVSIGNNVIVGAGSVVTKSIPDGYVAAGNPARIIGSFDTLRERIIRTWPSESDKRGMKFRESVDRHLDETPKRPMPIPNHLR